MSIQWKGFLGVVIFLALYGCATRQKAISPPLTPPPTEKERVAKEERPCDEPMILEEKIFEICFEDEVRTEGEVILEKRPPRPSPPKEEEGPPKIEPLKAKEERKAPTLQGVLQPGEELLFGIKYLGLRVGIGALKTQKTIKEGHPCYHFISTVRSTGIFALLYRVNERLDSFMDSVHLHSIRFEQRSYGKDQEPFILIYDQKRHIVHIAGKKETYRIHPNTHDPLSAFYFLRIQPLEPGKEILIPVSTGKETHFIEAKVVGREKVRVGAGEFDCLIIKPSFKKKRTKERLTLYLSDDGRRIPVLIKSELSFGSVVIALEEIG
jgi:hypothetical protein